MQKIKTPEPVLIELEKELQLPRRLPILFRTLLLNYSWDAVDLNGYSLLAHSSGENLADFKSEQWPELLKHKLIRFGKGGKYDDFDPVCFDMTNNMAIVKLDHEEILQFGKIRVVKKLASNFYELVKSTIQEAVKIKN